MGGQEKGEVGRKIAGAVENPQPKKRGNSKKRDNDGSAAPLKGGGSGRGKGGGGNGGGNGGGGKGRGQGVADKEKVTRLSPGWTQIEHRRKLMTLLGLGWESTIKKALQPSACGIGFVEIVLAKLAIGHTTPAFP